MKPSDNRPKQYGALVFSFASITAGATSTATVKNNRRSPFVVTHIAAVSINGANSSLDHLLQVRDQATGQEWYTEAVQLQALVGAGITAGILAGDQGCAGQAPVKLAHPYVVAPGAQLLMSATNAGATGPLQVVLSGFYLGAE